MDSSHIPAFSVKFKKLHPDAIIPTRGTPTSAGFDLYALEDCTIHGGRGSVIVPTGISISMPVGTYGRIAMRSGLAVKQHLSVSAGVIDVDFKGAIGVITYCTLSTDQNRIFIGHSYTIKKGERFAQVVIEKCCYATGYEVFDDPADAADTSTTHAGFGSTGKF
jgi:deoxyuridine 5'-triphosphate nucleotidohydrolase